MRKNITCDKCGHTFSSMDIKIKDRILDKEKDVREEYFKCPKCNAKYQIRIIDPEIRKLIADGNKDEAKEREVFLKSIYKGE